MNTQSGEKQLADLVAAIMKKVKKDMEVKIPCIVTDVISRKKVTVKPLIKIVDMSGNSYSRDKIEGVPVFMGGAGGMLISFPVRVGDIGWLEASDRDLSLFLQSFDESSPPTNRMHSFSDGLFVPDVMTDFTISDGDSLVIQNLDGSVKITVSDSDINIVNNSVSIGVSGSSVTGVAPGGFNLNGFTIDATGAAVSPVSVGAPTVAASASLTAAGVEMGGHTHGGVNRGNGTTDPVV